MKIFIRITKNHTSQLLHFLPFLPGDFRSFSEFRDPAVAEGLGGRCTEYATTCQSTHDAGPLKEMSIVMGTTI